MKHSHIMLISLLMFDSEKVDYAIKENPKDVCDENRPYRISQVSGRNDVKIQEMALERT